MLSKVSTLIVVNDIEKSKKFYKTVLGLRVISDLGANAELTGGLSLQTLPTWTEFIHKSIDEIKFGGNDAELYFECDEFDAFIDKINGLDIEFVHSPQEHSWGQRVVRIYDPDRHIIEIGEDMTAVVKRFIDMGMSDEQIAARMDVPLKYILKHKRKQDVKDGV